MHHRVHIAFAALPETDYYDPTAAFSVTFHTRLRVFAAIGTALSRTIFNLHRKPFKVIVLDCDNAWKGLCSEDGPLGVEWSPPYKGCRNSWIGQMNRGMLLCLCSKNSRTGCAGRLDRRTTWS
jgi:predicted enzyme involved in methoxymalonyl-ACP biosynthesis